jgi:hypothetical protein
VATGLTGFLRPVDRMPRIEWKTVRSDVPMESEALRELFFVVAADAKRLQFSEDESIPVAAVRFDVIGLGGWGGDAAFEATAAKRLDAKLMGTPVPPELELIPLTPVAWGGAFLRHAGLAHLKAAPGKLEGGHAASGVAPSICQVTRAVDPPTTNATREQRRR